MIRDGQLLELLYDNTLKQFDKMFLNTIFKIFPCRNEWDVDILASNY